MKSVGNWTRDYVYNTNDNKLLGHTDGTTEYTYDAHGNITSMPHLTQMNWDYKNQLLGATNGTFESYYVYDANGNRVRKVVEKGNITEERFYVGDYEVCRKTTSGTLDVERTTVHISDDQKRIAMIDNDGTTETIRYQYDNHLGSASLELDQNAEIISFEEYHPFGTTSYRSGRNETETAQKRYKYVGKERDEETGLYYYGARYYASWIARFVSTDPMAGERSWVNPYNYVQNNPINKTDPTGALDDDPPNRNLEAIPINDVEGISAPATLNDNTNIIAGQPPKEILKPPKQLESFNGIPLDEVRSQLSAATAGLQAGASQFDKNWISGNDGNFYSRVKDPRLKNISSTKVLGSKDVVKLKGTKKLVSLNKGTSALKKGFGRFGVALNIHSALNSDSSGELIELGLSQALSRVSGIISLGYEFGKMIMDDPKFNRMKVHEYEQKVEQYRFGDSKKFENAKRNLNRYKNKLDPNRNRFDNRQYEFKQN
ncbi:MAG: RHS repeat-associated core domain-containing protein [Salinivirgaceae bacterium]